MRSGCFFGVGQDASLKRIYQAAVAGSRMSNTIRASHPPPRRRELSLGFPHPASGSEAGAGQLAFSDDAGTRNPLALPLLEQLPSEATDIASRNEAGRACLEEGILGEGNEPLAEEAASAAQGGCFIMSFKLRLADTKPTPSPPTSTS